MSEPASGAPLVAFLADMRRLRTECEWKREQTHRSLARYLLEETHETLEVLDAWETGPDPAHLCEELGDLLLQVYFHAVIAEESGMFTIDDVARGISEKMHRRNPHVFGADGERPLHANAAEINDAWQAIKASERANGAAAGVLDEIPSGLPALLFADKVLDRLEREPSVVEPVETELASTLGDRLLALVAEARSTGVDPEQELRDAVRRLVDASGRA